MDTSASAFTALRLRPPPTLKLFFFSVQASRTLRGARVSTTLLIIPLELEIQDDQPWQTPGAWTDPLSPIFGSRRLRGNPSFLWRKGPSSRVSLANCLSPLFTPLFCSQDSIPKVRCAMLSCHGFCEPASRTWRWTVGDFLF